ncbi:hypothetical protein AN958_12892 [Leucoagaricus sp. SymC.cos]|nr:hypothetical protein AN958_12892 [Leucoagaricus sp. SymC.cos]
MPLPPIVTTTAPNNFGLFRQYTQFPQVDPEDACTLDDYCNSPNLATNPDPQPWPWWAGMVSVAARAKEFYEPFLNATVYCLMSWFYGASGKSLDDLDKLVHDILLSPDYDLEHLKNFSAKQEGHRMDAATGMAKDSKSTTDFLGGTSGWKEGSVKLKVPVKGQAYRDEDQAPIYTVGGIYYRSIIDIIKAAFAKPAAASFHYIPYKLFWNHAPNAPPEHVITELYNSDAFLEEHTKLEQQHGSSGSPENAIAAIMLWSDSTHLANFSNAALWPIYCYFGNQSKYDRARPTSFAAHHLAYIPTLPQAFSDWYRCISNNASAGHDLLTHMKRELMQAIWLLLLDDEFRIAYIHGIVVKCADGVLRQLFPWFFTYSADYPEKVILATIRSLGGCPCPCCTITKQQIKGLGSSADNEIQKEKRKDDATRKHIVEHARNLIFKSGRGIGSAIVEKLLKPFSMTPTHCSIPVFESLLPDPHNGIVLDLLYSLGTWHALAKLRLSTETTWHFLHIATSQLGDILRKFEEATCAFFYTEKHPTDAATRGQQSQQSVKTNSAQQKEKGKASEKTSSWSFNLATYKLHLLGDYEEAIKMFGTSDGYSTQIGELEHRCIKKFYARTNKSVHLPLDSSEPLGPTPPANHYHISEGRSFPINVTDWLTKNHDDPATKNFLGLLKDHLLERLEGLAPGSKSYSAIEWNKLQFASNRIYQHKYMRINYTTYDLQQAQDSINPQTHPDIMVLAANSGDDLSTANDDHPYLYVRILGIFHGDVLWHNDTGVQRIMMHFLWLEFATDGTFGFLDPDNVIRGCHVIPAYAFKQVAWLGRLIAYRKEDNSCDWRYHYVNIFVDRDMFMRYLGGGIGHGPHRPAVDMSIESWVSALINLLRPLDSIIAPTADEEQLTIDKHKEQDEEEQEIEIEEYGYSRDSDKDFTINSESELEGNLDEDGEGAFDPDQPENNGYGAFN